MIILVAGTMLMLLGCQKPLAELDPKTVTQVTILHPDGGISISDQTQITTLITAMQNAKTDSTAYDTAKVLRIQFQQGETAVPSIPAGGPLFVVGNQQYYSNEFETVMGNILSGSKKRNK